MSAGSSSQFAACFSVERTKYLMFSKSIPDRSEPQVGMGLRRNSFRPFSRRSSIHCGSFFSAENEPQWMLDLRLKRSEEHTSELQSRQYLVCRLLLVK